MSPDVLLVHFLFGSCFRGVHQNCAYFPFSKCLFVTGFHSIGGASVPTVRQEIKTTEDQWQQVRQQWMEARNGWMTAIIWLWHSLS